MRTVKNSISDRAGKGPQTLGFANPIVQGTLRFCVFYSADITKPGRPRSGNYNKHSILFVYVLAKKHWIIGSLGQPHSEAQSLYVVYTVYGFCIYSIHYI